MKTSLPDQYITYIENGGELEFEADYECGGYIILEPLDTLEQFNKDIELSKYAPKYLAFASDGGGEVFTFDTNGSVYLLPLIGMSPDDAFKIADSWSAYESKKTESA